MENEEIEEQPITEDTNPYLEEIENLKNSTVSKEEYNKIKAERDQAVHKLATQRPVEPEQVVEKPTKEDLYNKLEANSTRLATEDLNGLEVAKILVENDGIEKQLGIDVFGGDSNTADDLRDRNDKTIDLMTQCIKDSNDDPSLFSQLMESRTTHTN